MAIDIAASSSCWTIAAILLLHKSRDKLLMNRLSCCTWFPFMRHTWFVLRLVLSCWCCLRTLRNARRLSLSIEGEQMLVLLAICINLGEEVFGGLPGTLRSYRLAIGCCCCGCGWFGLVSLQLFWSSCGRLFVFSLCIRCDLRSATIGGCYYRFAIFLIWIELLWLPYWLGGGLFGGEASWFWNFLALLSHSCCFRVWWLCSR